jgi:menadiol prenyltransferase
VNTFYDFKYGVDNKNVSSDRTLVDKLLTSEEITRFGVALYALGSFSFFIMLFVSPARDELLAFIYFGGLSLSFMYTGGIGFKYMALGDVIIIITFGPITVLFAYISQIGTMTQYSNDFNFFWFLFYKPLLFALPLALNTEAILHSNNARDTKEDKQSGIITIAIYLGFTGSYILYILLLFVPYLVFLIMAIKMNIIYLLPILTIKVAFDLEKNFRNRELTQLPQQTAKLNLIFGILYVLACLLD